MVKHVVSGGGRLDAYLREVAAKLDAPGTLEVGFMEDATEPDGTSIPMIAALNEFGGTVTIPARETTIHRSLNEASGEFRKGGRFVKAAQSNYATTHMVPEYTVTIPPRPFFRTMIAKESPHWGDDLGRLLVANGYDAERTLDQMGESMRGRAAAVDPRSENAGECALDHREERLRRSAHRARQPAQQRHAPAGAVSAVGTGERH